MSNNDLCGRVVNCCDACLIAASKQVLAGRDQTSIAAQVLVGRDQTSIAAQVLVGRDQTSIAAQVLVHQFCPAPAAPSLGLMQLRQRVAKTGVFENRGGTYWTYVSTGSAENACLQTAIT